MVEIHMMMVGLREGYNKSDMMLGRRERRRVIL